MDFEDELGKLLARAAEAGVDAGTIIAAIESLVPTICEPPEQNNEYLHQARANRRQTWPYPDLRYLHR